MNDHQNRTHTPRAYAFFDVDDTLIAVKSMLSFQNYWYQLTGDREAERRYRDDLAAHLHPNACWSFLNRLYYRHFRGRREADVRKAGRQWLEVTKRECPAFYHQSVVEQLHRHQQAGEEAVFVSGSFPALLDPIAEELGVDVVLSTRMEVVNGYFTGEILPPQTIGDGKADAIRAFLSERQTQASHCYGYGDDQSDQPMLEAVGHPHVVRGGRGLEALAEDRGWPVIDPQ